ncbi:MAG: TrmH family RNA methyltransferase, partial [Chloroflexota bacterium]
MAGAITSPANERVKYLRSLHERTSRQSAGQFLIEGIRLVEEALDAGVSLDLVLVDEDHLGRTARGRDLLAR